MQQRCMTMTHIWPGVDLTGKPLVVFPLWLFFPIEPLNPCCRFPLPPSILRYKPSCSLHRMCVPALQVSGGGTHARACMAMASPLTLRAYGRARGGGAYM